MLITNSIYSQKIITDRPDQTESSSTVPKGTLQIESGLLLGFVEKDNISERAILAPTTLFRLGLIKGVELRIVNQYESVKIKENSIKNNGISDIEIGIKIGILQKEDVDTEIAFLSHLIVPTGSKELTNDEFGTVNKIAISHELNDKIGLGYNLGYNYFGRGEGNLTYSLALGYGLSSKVGLYIETYGEISDMVEHFSNMDTGFTYLLKDNFQLDFSFGIGVNYTMNYIAVGFSWNIGCNK